MQQDQNPPKKEPIYGVSGVAPTEHHPKNIYPYMRHVLLIVVVLIALCTIIFLIHQNGKSIYEHGI